MRDPRIKQLLDKHETATVHDRGWNGFEDGPLLTVAQNHFEVFLTLDRNLEFQQKISNFRLGVVVIQVAKNQIAHYRTIQKEILAAIEEVEPGEVLHVVLPSP